MHYILTYCGVDYETKTYERGPAPTFSKDNWKNSDIDSLGLAFPNLPYLIDGEVRLSESKSIMKYVASKYDPDLLGRTAREIAEADMLSRVHDDLYGQVNNHYKQGDPVKLAANLRIIGQRLSTNLGTKPFFAGDRLTFVDFCFFELIELMDYWSEGATLADYPNLKAFHARISTLPRFGEAWTSDSKLRKRPFNFHRAPTNQL